MQQKIGGNHAGNRTRCTDQRAFRLGGNETMECGSRCGAEKIEDQEAEMAQRILDIIAKDPKEKHVGGEMPEIDMQEGIGQEGHIFRHQDQ
ncbi:hypothetical protein D3C71_1291180 [compost metagenome]